MVAEAGREDGYDIRGRHPDREDFYRLYRSRSEAVYGSRAVQRDLRYGPGPREVLDFFPPLNASEGAPLLIFIHGGFWHAHDKSEFAFIAEPFVSQGVAVALLNYDLVPHVPLGGIAAQVSRACAWLHAHAAPLGIDAGRIVVSGHSAGGHLALAMLLAPGRPPEGTIHGAIALSGIFDLRPLLGSVVNRHLGLDETEARENSPLLQLRRSRAKLLLAVGDRETDAFIEQTRSFAKAWEARNGAAEYLGVQAAHHYSIVLRMAEPDSMLFRSAIRLLR